MPTGQAILDYLALQGAVITEKHFIFTKGGHGTAYINMRAVAHDAMWMSKIGYGLAAAIGHDRVDLVIGPETLGRTLAQFTAMGIGGHHAIWCDMIGEGGDKKAVFSEKMNFGRLVEGKRVASVDDLLTTGQSMRLTNDLIRRYGGVPVVSAAAVRRTPDVSAEDCGVDELCVLADVPGFVVYSPEECAESGPCSRCEPVVLRPGHGHEWVKRHPRYPTV